MGSEWSIASGRRRKIRGRPIERHDENFLIPDMLQFSLTESGSSARTEEELAEAVAGKSGPFHRGVYTPGPRYYRAKKKSSASHSTGVLMGATPLARSVSSASRGGRR